MAKTTQLERAITALQVKRDGLADKARLECDALDTAIEALRAQQRTKKPRTAKRERASGSEKAVAQAPLN